MMEKFTKEPWVVEKFSDNSQIHVYSADYRYTLHHHKKFSGFELTDIDIANAALIAAAPEMYEMLKSIKLLAEYGYSHSETGFELISMISDLSELLAKARGEQ